MKPGTIMSAAALAFVLAVPAQTVATAAPFAPIAAEPVRSANGPLVHKVGYRHDRYRKFSGGISYVGEYGLKYAPSYWRHRHYRTKVTVNIYAEQPRYADQGQRSRPLIIDVPQ